MLWHLITTIRAEQAVLPTVGLLRLLQDVRNELLVAAVRASPRSALIVDGRDAVRDPQPAVTAANASANETLIFIQPHYARGSPRLRTRPEPPADTSLPDSHGKERRK
jgi:hypothetical protein